jgi:hypothetical protein
MSIASMSDASLTRARHGIKIGRGSTRPTVKAEPAHDGTPNTTTPASITPLPSANDVARWIPTEAIALYLAFYSGIFGASVDGNTDFTTRWQFFTFFGLVGTAVLVVLIYTAKWQDAPDKDYKFPLFEIVIADLAFAAWALALPAAPSAEWGWGDWFPVAVLLLATSLIPLIAGALNMNPPIYTEASAPAKPDQPEAVIAAVVAPPAKPNGQPKANIGGRAAKAIAAMRGQAA